MSRSVRITAAIIMLCMFLFSCSGTPEGVDSTLPAEETVMAKFSILTARSSSTSYDPATLYWQYKAAIPDSPSATGTKREWSDLNGGSAGFPETIGPFRAGRWNFEFRAFLDSAKTESCYSDTLKADVTLSSVNNTISIMPQTSGSGTIVINNLLAADSLENDARILIRIDDEEEHDDTSHASLTDTGYVIDNVDEGNRTVTVTLSSSGSDEPIATQSVMRSVSSNEAMTISGLLSADATTTADTTTTALPSEYSIYWYKLSVADAETLTTDHIYNLEGTYTVDSVTYPATFTATSSHSTRITSINNWHPIGREITDLAITVDSITVDGVTTSCSYTVNLRVRIIPNPPTITVSDFTRKDIHKTNDGWFVVTIESAEYPTAPIYYTTDGSEPDFLSESDSSFFYTKPFHLPTVDMLKTESGETVAEHNFTGEETVQGAYGLGTRKDTATISAIVVVDGVKSNPAVVTKGASDNKISYSGGNYILMFKVGDHVILDGVECVVISTGTGTGENIAVPVNPTEGSDKNFFWGAYGTAVGASGTRIGTGLSNSNTALEYEATQSSGYYTNAEYYPDAAEDGTKQEGYYQTIWKYLSDFRAKTTETDTGSVKYSDRWFIPSLDELIRIHALYKSGMFGSESFASTWSTAHFWSSSEGNSRTNYRAMDYDFRMERESEYPKWTAYGLRLCREIGSDWFYSETKFDITEWGTQ